MEDRDAEIVAGKLHGIHVTKANLYYHGLITLDPERCEGRAVRQLSKLQVPDASALRSRSTCASHNVSASAGPRATAPAGDHRRRAAGRKGRRACRHEWRLQCIRLPSMRLRWHASALEKKGPCPSLS
ncbi:aspartate 1-decarboxylase [Mesorhizobium sp. M0166]|uniref:aspartate 1-decarboxylase n=1 Tax=Mesorhizobium sp. M0166 TaxID=2956902 RepID=UPI00333D687F